MDKVEEAAVLMQDNHDLQTYHLRTDRKSVV